MNNTPLHMLQIEVERKRSEIEEREAATTGVESAILSGKLLAYEDVLRKISIIHWKEATK